MFEAYTKREKRLSIYLGITAILTLMILSNIKFDGFQSRVIDGDGKGYYAWLPAIFIHNSLDFTSIYEYEKSTLPDDYMGHYFIDHQDIKINKYYSGTAILMMPFFLLAFFLSWVFGFDLSGYSLFFQYSILLAAVFYCLLGLILSYSILRRFGFDKYSSLLSIILILFGTNLFYYTFMHAAASHVYSFFAVSLFVYMVLSIKERFHINKAILLAFCFGLIILIRPVNGLVVLSIPFLTGGRQNLIRFVSAWFSKLKNFIIPFFVFLLTISIQLLLFYLQTGQIYVYTYQGEGFDFSNPEISNVLFSYRKGLFVYTPLLLFSFLGLIFLIRKNTFRFISGLMYLLIATYVISSWWNWYYGDSYGMRAFIDQFPFFIILLEYFLYKIRFSKIRPAVYLIFFFLVVVNLFQTYQYEHNILDRDSMNKEKYWYVFMKTDKKYEGLLSGLGDARFFEMDTVFVSEYFHDFDTIQKGWNINALKKIHDTALSGDMVCVFDTSVQYNAGIKITNDSAYLNKGDLIINAGLSKYDLTTDASLKLLLVAQIKSFTGTSDFYKTYRLSTMPGNTFHVWDTVQVECLIPEIKHPRDELNLYLWNQEGKRFYVDNVSYKIYRLRKDTITELDQLRR